ncbi:MAG: hypothetical protein KF814_06975 [Nitrospiraceae bacterium]|nr:hypothetical protein [Nitrospiraceae bacterium]
MVTILRDTWLKPGKAAEGIRLTRRIWSEMRQFEGFLFHQLFVDELAPTHLLALARRRSLADADVVRERYKDSDTVRQLTPLLTRPRERWITQDDDVSST